MDPTVPDSVIASHMGTLCYRAASAASCSCSKELEKQQSKKKWCVDIKSTRTRHFFLHDVAFQTFGAMKKSVRTSSFSVRHRITVVAGDS